MIATHATTMNGRINVELMSVDIPVEDEIRRLVLLLDGTSRYCLSLWALPPGLPLDDVDQQAWPQEFIQAAGSRDRMTVEVRRIIDGSPEQYVIGRNSGLDDKRAADEVVQWNDHKARVRPNELLNAEEAGNLFVAYYSQGNVPSTYSLRPIVL